jgi:D-lyxose ketol-isomerase
MKRSEINTIIRDALEFINQHRFALPPFAAWTVQDWQSKGLEVQELVERGLGWDVTDFGSDNYKQLGLFLFTIRNGKLADLETKRGKLYAEKLLVVGENQITPMHFHHHKTEDIINRGGGTLALELFWADEQNLCSNKPITVFCDGIERHLEAGGIVRLEPGESITLPTRLYHKFWGETSRVLVGEVSTVNDDNTDNYFLEPVGRFPEILEDEAPFRLLVGDYPRYYQGA